jgi:hypothetical protein
MKPERGFWGLAIPSNPEPIRGQDALPSFATRCELVAARLSS